MNSDPLRWALALVLASAAWTGLAHAQDVGSGAEDGATEDEAVDPRTEEARQRFLQALALADADNCEGALAELRAALALVRRPSILYNIARCQERLNRYDLAIPAYREYLAEAPPDDPDRSRAEITVEQLGRLLGTIHVSANVRAEVWLDDRVVGEAPGDVLVPGGRHVIELRADGRLPARREVEVSAGAEVSVEVELASAQEIHQHQTTTNVRVDAPPLPAALTVGMIGVSVISLGVGVGFGVNAMVLSDAEHARDARLPRDGAAIDESALFADIFFIAGGVLAAATLAMAFLTDWDDRGGEVEEQSSSVRVLPIVGPLYAGIRIEGIE